MSFLEEYEAWKKQRQQGTSSAVSQERMDEIQKKYTEWKVKSGKVNISDLKDKVDSRVNTWLENDRNYNSNYASRFGARRDTYGNRYVDDASHQYKLATKQKERFDIEAESILNVLEQYQDYFDQGWMDSVRTSLGAAQEKQSEIVQRYADDDQYWAQFGNEEGYLRYLYPDKYEREDRQSQYNAYSERIEELKKQKAAEKGPASGYLTGSSQQQTSPYAAALQAPEKKKEDPIDAEISRMETWNRNYERGNGEYSKVIDDYADIAERDDFKTVSAKKDYGNPTKEDLFAYDRSVSEGSLALSNGGSFDALGNILDKDGNIVQLADGDKIGDRLGLYLSATEEDKTEAYNLLSASNGNYTNTWANLIQTGDEGSWNQLSENEVAIYYYLLNNDGQEAADKYLDDMKVELNRRQTQWETQEHARTLDEAGILEKVMLNVATVPAQLLGGAVGFADDAINLIQGKDINPYSSRHALSNFGGTIRAAQAAELETATNGAAIPFVNFTVGDLYQAGMSMLDMGVGGKLGPGTYMALMGMGSASAEAKRLYEQGASREQIAWGGALAGAAEMVFEKVSIDKLIDLKDAKTVGQMVKNALIQGGVEASEEGFTEIANTLTNALVMGDQSDWAILLKENNGDAVAALMAKVSDVAKASLGGFISGMGSGGTHSAGEYLTNQAQSAQTGQYIDDHLYGTDALMALAEEVAGYSSPKPQASLEKQSGKLHDAVYDGNGNRAKAAGKLYGTVRTAIAQQNQADIAKGLEEKGFSPKQAKAIAEAAAASMNGEKLTERQEKTLDRFQNDNTVRDVVLEVAGGEQATRLDAFHAAIATDTAKTFRGGAQTASRRATQTAPRAAEQTNAERAGKVFGTEKMPSESRYEVSADGTTILNSTGETVGIKEVASIKDGKMALKLNDGRTVSANDVSYASEDEALVYEAVAEMGVNASAANVLVGAYHTDTGVSAEAYSLGVKEAYKYGQYNFPMQEVVNGPFSSMLTDHQRNTAYRLGQMFNEKQTANAQATIKSSLQVGNGKGKAGKVHFDGDYSKLNERQRTSLSALETVADALGVQIHVFESGVDADGRRTGANGWYDATDSSIHIDLHSGVQGKDTILFTAAHELTHFIREWSPAKFKVLADFLMQEYGREGISVKTLVENQIAKAKQAGRKITYDTAYEEVVADSMETMLSDGGVVEKLARLKAKDKTLWEKMKDFFRDLAEKIREVYAGLKPDSMEGRYVAQMKDSVEQLRDLFTEGLVDASENYQAAGGKKNNAQEGGKKYSFAGRGSATADRSALQQAEQLAEAGVDNEAIRQRTGWYKGMDGRWRYEIDDSQMEIADEIINYMQLGELMRHEKLYAAYPDLADIAVAFQSLDAGVNGSYHPQFDSINLSYRLKNDPVGLKDALVHEIQHAIQHREGFTNGATAASWERKIKAGFDSRRTADIRKAQETERELRRIQEEEPEFYRDMVQLDSMTPDLPRGEVDWETLEKISDDPIEWQQYDARREELEAKYGDTKVWDMNDLLYQREQAAKNMGRSGVELYFDTAGEIEARNASNRRSKTPEQRKTSPPKLGNEDTVFAEGTGSSADYVGKTADGIEVYETSEKTKSLTWSERKKTFLHLMRQQYRGRTAKFIRNGHAYYAKFEYRDVSKNIYGDDKSDPKGRDAKINVGADGNIFELVENSKYSRGEAERGKTQRMHRGVNHWDYFVKTVQIDGMVFDLTANVRKKADGEFVYIIEMMENNEIEPSSPQDSQNSGRNGIPNSSTISISDPKEKVNKKFSDRDRDMEKMNRALTQENAKLKEDVDYLKEMLKLQRQVTGGTKFTKSSVETLAGTLMKDSGAKGNKVELATHLNGLYEYIAKGEELTWEGVAEMAKPAVGWIQSHIDKKPRRDAYATIDEWYDQESMAQDLLRQVYDGFWKVSTLYTVADKKQKEIARLKVEHSNRMNELRENHRKEVSALKADHRERVKAVRSDYRESANVKKQRAIVEKQVKDLTKMIANPTKDAHVPTVLHKPLQKLLDSIDFTSKRSAEGGEATVRDVAYTRALQSIRTAIAAQRTAMEGVEDGAFALDVPPEFLDKIDGHIKMINDATEGMDLTTNRVYDMSADELKDLAYLLGTINKAVRNIDKLHMEGAKARVSELAESTVREMGQRKPVKGEDGGGLMWANYTPTYAFERMGTAATQILDGLKQGQAKMARTVDGVLKFAAKTYDAKEVKAWQEKIHTVKLESGETVKLTTAQIMSFYCLSNRDQGVGHLTGGGIRVGTIGEGPGKTVQKQHFRLTVQDINQINGLLDKRQLEVAKAMQKYMQDVGGRLGNEISMARWGFMQMTEENYFPIRSDSDVHDGKNPDQEKANLWALLNKSFTKSVTKGANDAVVVSSIFDVFADHMAEMAEYNAFALPLVDAMKWYNYRSTTRMDGSQIETVGVKKSLNDTLGTAAGKYFIDLMTDINSSQKGGRHEDIMGKLLSYSKASSVGWNLRVAIQQPTAILRASLYLDMPDLARGSLRIGTKELVEEMQKYSGIAMWKSLGYYDLNVSRSVREQIKGNTNLVDTFNEWGMWLPGKVDEITWARIWAACKSKVSRTQNLKGEALLKETAKLFDDVVYHTQVVDSVLTKSSLMRSKSQIMKEFTSFMSEPTVSVNILMSAFQDYRQGKTNWEKAKRTFAICFKGYALSAMANALVTAFADAFRDDDEYEEFWEKYQQALLGEKFVDGNLFAELNPLEKLVFVKDALSLMRGYDVQNAYIKLAQGCIDLVNDIKKYLEGKGSITEYGVIYNALKVLGNFTGAAPANLARELVTIWNNTFGKLSGKKIHRYQTGVKDGIHNAFDAGTLTREEAIQELVLAQEAENEDEAYFQVKKWETGEDSKYADLYDAVEKNEGVDAAMKELTDHGVKEKDAVEAVRDKLKEWYIDPESEIRLTREETVSRLKKYTDLGSDEIQALVKKWDMELEAGFTYSELREQYVDGNISEKEAISYMQKYGGKTKEEAQDQMEGWTKDRFFDGDINADEAAKVLTNHCGWDSADAENKVRYWDFKRSHPDLYVDDAWMEEYDIEIRESGIALETFVEYRNKVKGITGEGKKDRRMAVIDSLPITDEQKDAIYFAEGWAESTLWQAPWH